MKRSLIIASVACVIIATICFFWLPRRNISLSKSFKSISQTDSLTFCDKDKPYIKYSFVLQTRVYVGSEVWLWQVSEFQDSLSVFNKNLMQDRFSDRFPEFFQNGKSQEILVPFKKFSFQNVTIDSLSYFLTIQRTLDPNTWVQKNPSTLK